MLSQSWGKGGSLVCTWLNDRMHWKVLLQMYVDLNKCEEARTVPLDLLELIAVFGVSNIFEEYLLK